MKYQINMIIFEKIKSFENVLIKFQNFVINFEKFRKIKVKNKISF